MSFYWMIGGILFWLGAERHFSRSRRAAAAASASADQHHRSLLQRGRDGARNLRRADRDRLSGFRDHRRQRRQPGQHRRDPGRPGRKASRSSGGQSGRQPGQGDRDECGRLAGAPRTSGADRRRRAARPQRPALGGMAFPPSAAGRAHGKSAHPQPHQPSWAGCRSGEFSSIIGLIKRAQATYARIYTVSGVICAFRKRALSDAGWWSPRTLTDDVDITWRVQIAGLAHHLCAEHRGLDPDAGNAARPVAPAPEMGGRRRPYADRQCAADLLRQVRPACCRSMSMRW